MGGPGQGQGGKPEYGEVDAGARTEIVRTKLPDASEKLSSQVTRFVQELRQMELYKVPGVAETLDWTRALMALDTESLDESVVEETLGALLKYRDDIDKVRGERAKAILERVAAPG